MGVNWNSSTKSIDIVLTTSSSTCKVAYHFEGNGSAKRLEIAENKAGGAVLKDVIDCSIQPGDEGIDRYAMFLPRLFSQDLLFRVTPYNGSTPCPVVPATTFSPFNAPLKVIVHNDNTFTYGSSSNTVRVLMTTFHFQATPRNNVHITITIEDVIL